MRLRDPGGSRDRPATAFLYSGPAINVLAIVLTAQVLGWAMGLARAVGAVAFSIITGLLMAFIFRKSVGGVIGSPFLIG